MIYKNRTPQSNEAFFYVIYNIKIINFAPQIIVTG